MEARALKVAYGARLLFAFVALFLPLGHPHVWRQVDTLGVSMRYWLRWTLESDTPWPLLPAVLHSGEGSGIMAMEWPLLNLLAAPSFAFGPAWGTGLARALVLGLTLILVLVNIRLWRGQTLLGIDASRSWRWMPLLGLGLVFFPKFIPDSIAMLLVLASVALILRQKWGWALGLLLAGLLMKPTAVIVLALLLLTPEPWSVLRRATPVLLFGLALPAAYYLKGTSWIQNLAGGESLYRLEPQHPWPALLAFLREGGQLWDLLLQGLCFYAGLPLLLLLGLFRKIPLLSRIWLLLGLQILAIAMLDGVHSYKHRYYFMGTLPLVCLLVQATLDASPRLRPLFLLLIAGSALNAMVYEWRPLYRAAPVDRFLSFQDCAALKAQLKDWPWERAAVFRTAPRPYPLVGLCFGERVGSEVSPFGLFVDVDPLPPDCTVVARSGHLLGASCGQPLMAGTRK